MGALTINRKRTEDYFKSTGSPGDQFHGHISKKSKLLDSMSESASDNLSSNSVSSIISRYPPVQNPIAREIHAPVGNSKFRPFPAANRIECSGGSKESSSRSMGFISGIFRKLDWNYNKSKQTALEGLQYKSEHGVIVEKEKKKEEEQVIVNEDDDIEILGGNSADSGIEELRTGDALRPMRKERDVVEMSGKENRSLDSSVATDASNVNPKIDRVANTLDLIQLDEHPDDVGGPRYKKLHNSSKKRNGKLDSLQTEIAFQEKLMQRLRMLWPLKKREDKKLPDLAEECFRPLTKEEEAEVHAAFSSSNRRKVLVSHPNSNIDITGEVVRCLLPGAWLNDEVINLYLELLKEREKREPEKFLKCHFFNTFFYKKLFSGRGDYNYQSVRRWTTQRKLGYGLSECDKIFVPIHQQVHWCLAIINKKEQKFQYLDSLGGVDSKVLDVLARYYVDEVKDKNEKDIDVSSWDKEFVKDLPEQKNGFDCGVFMIKYADFYSRDIGLCFSQENMPYFRLRTAKEILNLKAE